MNHLYLNDPGIFKKNEIFFYNENKKEVKDSKIISRISKYAVPPAWNNVWYAIHKKSHIQVYGTDISGKRQYILSTEWINNAKAEKYNRMKKFIKKLGSFKKRIKLPSRISTITKQILINLLFNLLIDTHIRVGNEIYADKNKTYGLTTLLQKHISFSLGVYTLNFTGKSKIRHKIDIPVEYNNIISKFILSNKNAPLFQLEGNIISSEELNNYLREHLGKEYTCKDFRTYSANILFIKSFLKKSKNSNFSKKIVLESIDESAESLGHTRNICKKSYISNTLIDYCLNQFSEAAGSSPSELLTKVWS